MFAVTCLRVVAVKNGCSVLDQETLKSAMSQKSFDEMI